MDDRVGQQLGNYRLLQLLGQGGFADVYLSEHIHLHTRAAIKVLQVRLVESNVQSFLNEARTIAHLVHPYIIRVLDFGVQDGIPFLVMDYAPKGTFRQRFLNRHGQPLPAASLFAYIRQVATALQYAHDKKLIHRDVKPENMLLGPNDEVLLSDFGFALIQSSTSRSSMETAGTAAYMAPEQLQGKPCPASDQYALGIIAYEWLTGSCPFQGTFFEIASQHMLTLPLPLRKKVPSLSAEVENVVMTALAKDPRQRFPTVQDFAVALENACSIGKVVSLIDQTRSDAITRLTDWSDNTRPVTDFAATQVQTKFPEPNSGIHDLSQSETHPFSQFGQSSLTQQNHALSSTRPLPPTSDALTTPISHDLSQSSQYPLTQQGHSRSGIRPLPPTPDALTTPISHDLSQSSQYPLTQQGHARSGIRPLPPTSDALTTPISHDLSQSGQYTLAQQSHSRSGIRPLPPTPDALTTPPSHDLSQSSQYTLTQQSHSRSGIRPLSPEPSSLIRESSPSVPNSLSTVSPMSMSNSQSSLSQNNLEQLNQQWQQPSDFASDRTQLKPASRQPFSQGQQGTTFKDDLQRYRRSGTPASMIIFVIALAILIIGGGAGLIYWSSNQPHIGKEKNSTGLFHGQINKTTSTFLTPTAAPDTTSTSPANINPYGIDQNILVVNSLLDSNSLTAQWQENPQSNCQFTNGSYHALAMPNLLTTCFAIGTTSYTNFTYEVQMKFIKNGPRYTSGGILFRGSKDQQQFYLFEVYASGRYLFQKCNKNGGCTILAGSTTDPPLPAYHVGQTNTLAVVAKQNMFSFYINQHLIGSQQTDNNNPYTQGMIGVLARGGLQTNIPTEVAYNHVRVWR